MRKQANVRAYDYRVTARYNGNYVDWSVSEMTFDGWKHCKSGYERFIAKARSAARQEIMKLSEIRYGADFRISNLVPCGNEGDCMVWGCFVYRRVAGSTGDIIKLPTNKKGQNKMINMATAQDYITDYITNSSQNPEEWNVWNAADQLVDYMRQNNIDNYDEVDEDVYTDILQNNAR